MIPLPATRVPVADGVEFVFPTDACCNCGTNQGLRPVVQDTRLTRYMLGGGSEYTFRLPLPFCQSCEVTAKRRPATFFHKGLVFGLLFAVGLLAVTITGIATGWLWPMEHPVLISMAFAAAVSFPWYSSRRPEPGQSSYYQPVRLLKLRQKFLSGVITGVKFGFSNHLYAEHLVSVNHEAVSSGILEITRL